MADPDEKLSSEGGSWVPKSEEERQAVHEQLERIVSDPLFKHSRRYPQFLHYVVEQTLAGNGDQLKQRIVGIEVFGRDPDYDTNLEPVVRTTAVEVRKRLAQYYQEPGRGREIRIELPLGSYVPEFYREPGSRNGRSRSIAAEHPVNRSGMWYVLGAVALLAIALSVVFLRFRAAPANALDKFWQPILSAPAPVLLCLGGLSDDEISALTQRDAVKGLAAYQVLAAEHVALSDATTLSRVAEVLRLKGKPHHIKSYRAATFADFRAVPVVLIGAFNNPWSLQFNRPLRFTFETDNGSDVINDRQRPSGTGWQVSMVQPYSTVTDDYAIISRVFDPNTQGTIVTIGGLMKWGTEAAGEFLSEPAYMEGVARSAPADWAQKNIQIVIGTKVFKENFGSPRLLAVHSW